RKYLEHCLPASRQRKRAGAKSASSGSIYAESTSILGFERPAAAGAATMSGKERVDRAFRGQDVDRTPFTFWYHFGLEKRPGVEHTKATLDFHRRFRTDLVKVIE